MALRYVIKKRTFGFDKTKAEKLEWFPVEQ